MWYTFYVEKETNIFAVKIPDRELSSRISPDAIPGTICLTWKLAGSIPA